MASASRSIVIDVSPEAFYRVVQDYARYPEFLTEVKSVRLGPRQGEAVEVTYWLDVKLQVIDFTLLHQPRGPERIEWHLLRGGEFMRKNQGAWTFERTPAGFTRATYAIEDLFEHLPIHWAWWPAIGAVGFASIGVALPRVLGVGYDQISLVLAGRLGLALLAALAVAKLVAWWVALASGTSGGTLAPILLISGAFGAFLGQGAGRAFPWAHLSPGAFALVAMAATFGAATRATFASIIFLFELTRDYNAILPLMLASVVADLVAAWAMDDGIMTEKLTRRGLRVASDYHADVLGTTRVRAVMTAPVETVHDRDTVATVASRFKFDGHGAYPIVDDDGRCVGIVARGDLLRLGWGDEEILGEVALGEVVSVSPDDLVIDALRLILEEQIDHVPVIAGDRLLGICTRTDILRARREQFAHEKPQPGWRPVRRRRSG